MVVVAGETDHELSFCRTKVPPQLPVYQSVIKGHPGLFTDKVEEPPPHNVAGFAVIPVGSGIIVTLTVTF